MPNNIFEQINEYGSEYWSARELCKALGYNEFNKFMQVIAKAEEACKASKQAVLDHVAHVSEMVSIDSGAKIAVNDYTLSRYACYLIAQNGDPRKEEIALAQTGSIRSTAGRQQACGFTQRNDGA
jgi:DNA-damage-inducible protein D